MIKRVLIITTLSLLGVFASMEIGHVWTDSILSSVTFTDEYGLNALVIAMWLPTIAIFFVIGAVLKRLFRGTGHYGWPCSVGVMSALIWLSLIKTIFFETPSVVDVFWAYSELAMPVWACMLGWFVAKAASVQFSSDKLEGAD